MDKRSKETKPRKVSRRKTSGEIKRFELGKRVEDYLVYEKENSEHRVKLERVCLETCISGGDGADSVGQGGDPTLR